MDLVKKYKITRVDALKCSLIRSLKGSGMPPHYLLRYSSKKYGAKDNLGRYYSEKYLGVPVGKFTWGYNSFYRSILVNCIESVGSC